MLKTTWGESNYTQLLKNCICLYSITQLKDMFFSSMAVAMLFEKG